MNIAITGGTGFVGSELSKVLIERGHTLYILTRNPSRHQDETSIKYIGWLTEEAYPEKELQNVDVFVNLAGESINSGRWTEERKQRILDSRIQATKEVIRIIESLNKKPSALINASAIGYYPASQTETYTETATNKADDFLGHTVQKWEEEASKAKALGLRTAFTRFGIILGKEEGALPKMALPYKLFVGGKVGSGKQWLSWVHLKDVAEAIAFVIETSTISGPVNITAPHPYQMNDFGKVLAQVLGRPHWIPAPAFALKLALGEMSQLVLEGQKVLPKVLEEHGYRFHFPHLKPALEDIYQ